MKTHLQKLEQKSYEANTKLYHHFTEIREPNAIARRLSLLLTEMQQYTRASINAHQNKTEQKEFLSILYRNADETNEMYTMLQNVSPINLQVEINPISDILVELVPNIVEEYGKEETLFIITPRFQQLSNVWR
jgi:hypothetical protein